VSERAAPRRPHLHDRLLLAVKLHLILG